MGVTITGSSEEWHFLLQMTCCQLALFPLAHIPAGKRSPKDTEKRGHPRETEDLAVTLQSHGPVCHHAECKKLKENIANKWALNRLKDLKPQRKSIWR